VFSALAQSDRGILTGAFSDPANATVPGAKIFLRNMKTGAQYESVTTITGNYTVTSLPAGRCELSVEAAGFTKYVQQGITIQVAQTSRQDVTLKVLGDHLQSGQR
jgi:hypothetical protein